MDVDSTHTKKITGGGKDCSIGTNVLVKDQTEDKNIKQRNLLVRHD